MTVLFFAYLRERAGTDQLELELPPSITTIADLVEHLGTRNDAIAGAFEERVFVRMAVNQKQATWETQIKDSDEVAFFPPITGG